MTETRILAQCQSCGRKFDEIAWNCLKNRKTMQNETGITSIELAQCPCGNTLAIEFFKIEEEAK